MAEIVLGKLTGPIGFERPVVIKRILPHLARQSLFVEMFLDEARIGAEIRHPNVVQTYELGRDGDELFLVLEYLEGESGAGLMRRAAARSDILDYGLAAYIIAEACAGLHAAHELKDRSGRTRHLVHRDVSPQNVFITYAGEVKVLDFGIAKAAGRLSHTEVGQVKGKFSYMSPEQCLGAPLDPRSDIFSLGIVLYEVSTFRRLFKRANDLMVLKAVTEEPITPPSREVPGYPPCLEAIILKALSRPREQRYQSATEMRRELLAAMRELGVGDEPSERLSETMHRLFPERIEEKRQMLQRVQAGSHITRLPPSEIDQSIDLPSVVAMISPMPSMTGSAPAPDLRPQRWLTLGVGAVVLVSVLTAGLIWNGRSGAPQPIVVAPPAALDPGPGRAVPASAPASLPAEVVIRIETTPPGVRLVVNGQVRGVTPVDVRVPRSKVPVPLELSREGFDSLSEQVVPDENQRLRLSLSRERKPGRLVVRPPRKVPEQPQKKGFSRFD
jgi:serine/threonine-protein kinase